MKIFESELRILDILWRFGPLSASETAKRAEAEYGWSVTTTYTVIKKCISKRLVRREDPGFLCRPLVTRQQVQADEAQTLLGRLFNGKVDCLVASLASENSITADEIENLKKIIEDYEAK